MATTERAVKRTISATGSSYIKEGKESIKPSSNDLFDKIINLRFIRKSGNSFTLRSDYEPVFHKDGSISFRKCTQKPDIKISYKQVAESVAIEIDIYITNLFVGDDNKNIDTADGDPVKQCVIQMGYRSQFLDWSNSEVRGTIDQYYALEDYNVPPDEAIRYGSQIVAQILTGYPQSYPPDKVTYFKGIVGSVTSGLVWTQTKAEMLAKNYGDPAIPEDASIIEAVLYQFVTRRFMRSSVIHKQEKDGIYVYGKDGYEEKTFTDRIKPSQKKPSPGKKTVFLSDSGDLASKDKWGKLELMDNGLMSAKDANRFGVICAVSQKVRELVPDTIRTFGVPEGKKPFHVPVTSYNDPLKTVGGQIVSIEQHYPFLRHFVLMDGSYYFYHVSEKDEDLYKDPYIKMNRKYKTLTLPAIYDMTPSGTRSIRCPFISFLSPTMTVRFQSRFTISTFIGYYYAPKTDRFLVIISNVSFATVQEDNMMELMCVDVPGIKDDEDEEPDKKTEPAKGQELRNKAWELTEKTVVLHPTPNENTTFSRWRNIADALLATFRADRFPEGTKPTRRLALEKLREHNQKYFDPNGSYMKGGSSIENDPFDADSVFSTTGIRVCWLHVGDKINVPFPLQDEYPPNERIA